MARKRTAEHRAKHDNTTPADRERRPTPPDAAALREKALRHTEAIQARADAERAERDDREEERDPHAGLPGDDLSQQVRPMSDEEPAAEMPAAVEEERERVRGLLGEGGGGPAKGEEHPFAPVPIEGDRLVREGEERHGMRPVYREVREGEYPSYGPLARTGDIEAAGLGVVDFSAAYPTDPDAPLAGEEGGPPLGEPTEDKHHPGAPWPSPAQVVAAAPTASPQPGAEPSVQYEPPQDVEFRDVPEAASGVTEPPPPPDPEPPADRTKRYTTRKPAEPARQDGKPRDEAGQLSIEAMADEAIKAIGGLAGEEAEPYRVQKALELAARRVMSGFWWNLREKYFLGGNDEGSGPEPEPQAA